MTHTAPGRTSRALTLLALIALLFPAIARAQDADEIRVNVVQYGLGQAARAGDWAGVQINLLDSATEQREVLLRLAVRDADGDRALYDRVVTANPGVEQSFWLYARLPFRAADDPPGVLVFEAIETSGQSAYRAGRLLGRWDPAPSQGSAILPPQLGLAAVVGPYAAGLEQYNVSVSNRPWAPLGHELTRVVTGVTIPSLPDHWQGLEAFDTLLWTESTTRDTEPSALTPERARAVRTWVERGGHLIILLPPAGDPWFGAPHPLRALLPDIQRPDRREGVDLATIRPLLTESADVRLPTNAVLHTFSPRPGADPEDAQRVLTTPDGACVAIRRVVGSGAVTVVGLDLTSGPLRRLALPDAESFWHRVLGRRGDVRRIEEFEKQELSDAGNARRDLDFDHDISASIARTGRAVQGILFGLVVFITYWLVAGPVGYLILKRRNLHQHAWVAFVAATAAFTALAWAGATTLRPKRVSLTHLTLLDFVAGQPDARARTWTSVMLPSYGSATISLQPPATDANAARPDITNLLTPWEPPGNIIGWTKGFPDNTGYHVDAKAPDTLTVPTRATIKQLRADIAGVTSWSPPALQRAPGDLDDPRITIQGASLTGVIAHNLPAPMTDVRVLINPGQVRVRPGGSALGAEPVAPIVVLAPRFADENKWNPGEPLDLAAITTPKAVADSRSFDYFRQAVRYGVATGEIGPSSSGSLTQRLLAARFISQMAPPNFRDERDTVATRLARRVSTHAWDLGRWMTTPCVIVTGFVDIPTRDASPQGVPFPIYVEGRAAPASGLTMVTWIYPLPDDPPQWPGAAERDEPNQTPPPAEQPASTDANDDE